jgi:parallel beta-helix repeat protein
MNHFAALLAFSFICPSPSFAAGGEVRPPIFVQDTAMLIKAVSGARPGDQIVIKAGEYMLEAELPVRVQGSEEAPLLIKSETLGEAIFKGSHTFAIRNSTWVTLEGLTLAHRIMPKRAGLSILDSQHIRITRCRFSADETGVTPKDAYNSVSIERSSHVRVDHGEFGPRASKSTGDYVSTHLGSRYLQIDHNYFQHRSNIGQNGGETVLLHGAGVWAHHAVVEDNLFEECNGEGEMIGLKSSRNTIRNNTIINCEGAISIRDGSYNKIYGNTILNLLPRAGLEGARVGGVRIFGTHNEVIDNYMFGLAMPLQSGWGDADPPHEDDGDVSDRQDHGRDLGYIASHDNLIAHNTFVECDSVLLLGKTGIDADYVYSRIAKVAEDTPIKASLDIYRAHTKGKFVTPHLAPARWCFLNNLSFNNRDFFVTKIAREAQPPYEEEAFTHLGNVSYSTDKSFSFGPGRQFAETQWRVANPKLVAKGGGIYELDSSSNLKGGSRHDDPAVEIWMMDADTKAQLESCKDIGANTAPRVLTRRDVGIHSP